MTRPKPRPCWVCGEFFEILEQMIARTIDVQLEHAPDPAVDPSPRIWGTLEGTKPVLVCSACAQAARLASLTPTRQIYIDN